MNTLNRCSLVIILWLTILLNCVFSVNAKESESGESGPNSDSPYSEENLSKKKKECDPRCLVEFEKEKKRRDRTEELGAGQCKCDHKRGLKVICGSDGFKYRNDCFMRCLSKDKSVARARKFDCEVRKEKFASN